MTNPHYGERRRGPGQPREYDVAPYAGPIPGSTINQSINPRGQRNSIMGYQSHPHHASHYSYGPPGANQYTTPASQSYPADVDYGETLPMNRVRGRFDEPQHLRPQRIVPGSMAMDRERERVITEREIRDPNRFNDRNDFYDSHEPDLYAQPSSGRFHVHPMGPAQPVASTIGTPNERHWGASGQTQQWGSTSQHYDKIHPSRQTSQSNTNAPSFTIREMPPETAPIPHRERMWNDRNANSFQPHSPPGVHPVSHYQPVRPVGAVDRENTRSHPYRRPMMHGGAAAPAAQIPATTPSHRFRSVSRSRSVSPSRTPPSVSRDGSPVRSDVIYNTSPQRGARSPPRVFDRPANFGSSQQSSFAYQSQQSSVPSPRVPAQHQNQGPYPRIVPNDSPAQSPHFGSHQSHNMPQASQNSQGYSFIISSSSSSQPPSATASSSSTVPPTATRRQLTVKRKNQRSPTPVSPTARPASPAFDASGQPTIGAGQPTIPPRRRAPSPTLNQRASSPSSNGTAEEGEIHNHDESEKPQTLVLRPGTAGRRPQFSKNRPSASTSDAIRSFPSPVAPVRGVSQSSILSVASGVFDERENKYDPYRSRERHESIVPLPVEPSPPDSEPLTHALSPSPSFVNERTEPVPTIDTVAPPVVKLESSSRHKTPHLIEPQLLVQPKVKDEPVEPSPKQSPPLKPSSASPPSSNTSLTKKEPDHDKETVKEPIKSPVIAPLTRATSLNIMSQKPAPVTSPTPSLSTLSSSTPFHFLGYNPSLSSAAAVAAAAAATSAAVAKKRRVGFGMGLARLEKKQAPETKPEEIPATESTKDTEESKAVEDVVPVLLRSNTAPQLAASGELSDTPTSSHRNLSVSIPTAGGLTSGQSAVDSTPLASPLVDSSFPASSPRSPSPASPMDDEKHDEDEEKQIIEAVAAIPPHLLEMSKHSLLAAIQKLDEQINEGEDERDRLSEAAHELQLKQEAIALRIQRGLSATKPEISDESDSEANDWEPDFDLLEREQAAKDEADHRIKEKETEARLREEWNQFESFHLDDPKLPEHIHLTEKIYVANVVRAARSRCAFSRVDPTASNPLNYDPDQWPTKLDAPVKDPELFVEEARRLLELQQAYKLIRDEPVYRENLRFMPARRSAVAAVVARRKRTTGQHIRRLLVEFMARQRQYEAEEAAREAHRRSMPPLPRMSRNNVAQLDRATMEYYIQLGESQSSVRESVREAEAKRQRYERGACAVPDMILDPHNLRYSRFKSHNLYVEDPREEERQFKASNPWTEREKQIFQQKYLKFPKQFRKIATFLPNKNVNDCVAYYYYSKLQINYKELLRNQQKKTKKRRKDEVADEEAEAEENDQDEEPLPRRGGKPRTMSGAAPKRVTANSQRAAGRNTMNRELIGLAMDISNSTVNKAAETAGDDDEAASDDGDDETGGSRSRKRGRVSLTVPQRAPPSLSEIGVNEMLADTNEGDDDDMNSPPQSSDDGEEELHPTSLPSSPPKGGSRRRRSHRPGADPRPFWTDEERALFLEALDMHGKQFNAIAAHIGTKSVEKCKNYWNNNKIKLHLEAKLSRRDRRIEEQENQVNSPPEPSRPSLSDLSSDAEEDDDGHQSPPHKRSRTSRGEDTSSSKPAVVHWSAQEKEALMNAVTLYGRDWNALSDAVPSRTLKQIKTWWQNNMQRLGLKELARNAMNNRQSNSSTRMDQQDSGSGSDGDDTQMSPPFTSSHPSFTHTATSEELTAVQHEVASLLSLAQAAGVETEASVSQLPEPEMNLMDDNASMVAEMIAMDDNASIAAQPPSVVEMEADEFADEHANQHYESNPADGRPVEETAPEEVASVHASEQGDNSTVTVPEISTANEQHPSADNNAMFGAPSAIQQPSAADDDVDMGVKENPEAVEPPTVSTPEHVLVVSSAPNDISLDAPPRESSPIESISQSVNHTISESSPIDSTDQNPDEPHPPRPSPLHVPSAPSSSSPDLNGQEGLLSSSPSPSISSTLPAPPSPSMRALSPSPTSPQSQAASLAMSRQLSTFSPLSHLAHHPLSPVSPKSSPVSSSPPSPTPSMLSLQSLASTAAVSNRRVADDDNKPATRDDERPHSRSCDEDDMRDDASLMTGISALAQPPSPARTNTPEQISHVESGSDSRTMQESADQEEEDSQMNMDSDHNPHQSQSNLPRPVDVVSEEDLAALSALSTVASPAQSLAHAISPAQHNHNPSHHTSEPMSTADVDPLALLMPVPDQADSSSDAASDMLAVQHSSSQQQSHEPLVASLSDEVQQTQQHGQYELINQSTDHSIDHNYPMPSSVKDTVYQQHDHAESSLPVDHTVQHQHQHIDEDMSSMSSLPALEAASQHDQQMPNELVAASEPAATIDAAEPANVTQIAESVEATAPDQTVETVSINEAPLEVEIARPPEAQQPDNDLQSADPLIEEQNTAEQTVTSDEVSAQKAVDEDVPMSDAEPVITDPLNEQQSV